MEAFCPNPPNITNMVLVEQIGVLAIYSCVKNYRFTNGTGDGFSTCDPSTGWSIPGKCVVDPQYTTQNTDSNSTKWPLSSETTKQNENVGETTSIFTTKLNGEGYLTEESSSSHDMMLTIIIICASLLALVLIIASCVTIFYYRRREKLKNKKADQERIVRNSLTNSEDDMTYMSVQTTKMDNSPLNIVNSNIPTVPADHKKRPKNHVNIVTVGDSTDDVSKDYNKTQIIVTNETGSKSTMKSSGFFEEENKPSLADTNVYMAAHPEDSVRINGDKAKRQSNTYVSEPTNKNKTDVTISTPQPAQNPPLISTISHNPNPTKGFRNRSDSVSTEDSEDRWVPWSDKVWVNTTSKNLAAQDKPALSKSNTSIISNMSEKFTMPSHSRKMMKEERGPEDLRVHQARLVNPTNYDSGKMNRHNSVIVKLK